MQNEAEKVKLIDARLSEQERSALIRFNSDEKMVLAVEKVMMYMTHMMGVVTPEDKEILDVNWAFLPHNTNTTDEDLGRELRAKIAALSYLGDAFKQLRKFTGEKASPYAESNPALGK